MLVSSGTFEQPTASQGSSTLQGPDSDRGFLILRVSDVRIDVGIGVSIVGSIPV
jgi:hypothetical protein